MSAPIIGDKRMVVAIRVRGESPDHEGHEWSFHQIWDKAAAVQFLQVQMRKSEKESQRLLRSYERFRVEVTLNPGATMPPNTTDEALAKVE